MVGQKEPILDNMNTMPASIAALPFDYQMLWMVGFSEREILAMHALNELDAQSSRVEVGLN